MRRINLYLSSLLLAMLLGSCVREIVQPIPIVEFSVSWVNARPSSNMSDATYYLYPQFQYEAGPIIVSTTDGAPAKAQLLPGKYKVHMVNTPIEPAKMDGEATFERLNAYVDASNGYLPSVPQIMGLEKADKNHEIEVVVNGTNQFLFTPISLSKRLRFVINSGKFGTINIVDAYVSGVSGRINFSTAAKTDVGQVIIPKWSIDGNKLTSDAIEVLGFNHETEKIMLVLLVSTAESVKPLEQPVDITKEMSQIQGDEIEITMNVDYTPDIRITTVSIKEWEAGKELGVDIE